MIREQRLERKRAQPILHRLGIIGKGKPKSPIPVWKKKKKSFSAFLLIISLPVKFYVSVTEKAEKVTADTCRQLCRDVLFLENRKGAIPLME